MPKILKHPITYRQFGTASGLPVIYFHGAPGTANEGGILDRYGKEQNLCIICYERSSIDPLLQGDAYFQYMADEITDKIAGQAIDFVGFSIGGFVALQVCRRMPNEIRSVHLVSSAAPLEAGDFINFMAGKPVFHLAQHFPALFLILARLQGLITDISPKLLFRLLFASATGADKVLMADSVFQTNTTQILKTCFSPHPQAYVRDIKAYVQPWQDLLPNIMADTFVWHGAEDNWSPVSMAVYLETALPNCKKLSILAGLSHYSCLHQIAPDLCRTIQAASTG